MNVAADSLRMLYRQSSGELHGDLARGIERAVEQFAMLRPADPGVLARCDRLAEQMDGLRLGVLRLRSAVLRESRTPPDAA